ncbi:ABC transporter substrate-binding protein [Candidatus Cyrtobacter comes]|uniref:ABC transporter substrate-binding protein n=1 Tax=Candidatus Cyrtobacter comes TaxID=675776 RepID=A0ABU5L8T3_9RICK|nr:ABC transporter substrate-binding protein [Candidatus Cyrtobacter comes]MDZ5762531.1 ABC transporter substrate-binding protein [Candidatus Cyrtobacter comes]
MKKVGNMRILFLMIFFLASASFASEEQNIRNFINSVVQNVLDIASSSQTEPMKKKELISLFHNVVDSNWMSRFAIGNEWKNLNAEQQQDYTLSYERYIECLYVEKFKIYDGRQENKIISIKELPRGQASVETKITAARGDQDVTILYRLRRDQNNNWKVIDIIAEGISLMTTQRSDFKSEISQHGLSSLLQNIKEKTKKCH